MPSRRSSRSVRSFVFIDGIDEVTRHIRALRDRDRGHPKVNLEADVVWADGHRDYGHALSACSSGSGDEIGPKASILVLGDARNNYHASQAWVLARSSTRARRVFWLNPEPRAYWGSGDSILEQYAQYCDAVFECRNLRQPGSLRGAPELTTRAWLRPLSFSPWRSLLIGSSRPCNRSRPGQGS